jgi:hypothetical protein
VARKTAHLKQFQFKKGGGKVGKASTKRPAFLRKAGKKK